MGLLDTIGGAARGAIDAVGNVINPTGSAQPAPAPTGDPAVTGNYNGDYASYYQSLTPEEYAARVAAEQRGKGPTDIERFNTAMPTSYYLGGDPNAANAYAAQAQATGQSAATKLNQAAAMSQGVGYEIGSQLAAAGTGYGEAIAGTGVQAGYNLSQTGQNYGEELAGLGAQSGYNLSKYGTKAATGINQTGTAAQDYSQQAATGIEGAGSVAQLYGIKSGQALDRQGNAALDYSQQQAGSLAQAGQVGQSYGFNQAAALGQQGTAAQQYGQQQAGSLAQAGQFGQTFGLNQAQALAGQGTSAQQYGINQAGQVEKSAAQLSQMGQGVYDQSSAAANRNIVGQQQAAIQGIESSEGPSAAQAQLQSGLNKSQAQSLAMARSGRGWGGSAGAMSQAQQQNAAMSQAAANQAAVLRAQEEAAFRTRAATNINAAASMGLNQAGVNDAQTRALIEAGMAGVQSGGQMRAQAASLGQNAYAQQLAAQQASASAGQAGIGQSLAAREAAAAIGQQSYAQQIAAQQAAAGVGQAGIAQTLAAQEAAAGIGQQGYAQQLAAKQAATQAGQAGIGQNIAGLQAAADVGQQGYAQQLAAQQAAGSLGVGAMQAGSELAMSGLQSGGQMAMAGIEGGGRLATESLAAGGGLALAGIEGGGSMQLEGLAQSGNQAGQAALIGLDSQQQAMAAQQQQVSNNATYMDQMLQNQGIRSGVAMNNANSQAAKDQAEKDRLDRYVSAGISFAGNAVGALSDRDKKQGIEPANREMMLPATDTSGNGGPGGYAWGTGVSGPNQAQSMASNAAADASSARAKSTKSDADMKAMLGKFGGGAQNFGAQLMPAGGYQARPAPSIPFQRTAIPQPNYPQLQLPALSDEREKESLAAIKETPGYSFDYKDPDAMGAEPGRQYGIMAQDLEKTPAGRSVVKKQPDGTRMVDTSRLALLEAGAMNAFSKEQDALKNEVAQLRKLVGKGKAA
jgi:hypothetical protein